MAEGHLINDTNHCYLQYYCSTTVVLGRIIRCLSLRPRKQFSHPMGSFPGKIRGNSPARQQGERQT
jgi:hypothetical protein